MSRSYTTFRETQPFTDGWKKATYSATAPSDDVHHPFIVDAEGRQMPIVRYASGSNGQTYVIKAEKIVEHSTVPAPVSSFWVAEYRYSSERPGKEELLRDHGVENRFTHLGSTYHRPEKVEYAHLDSPFDRPEEVEEFITKVVTEAGRGPSPKRPVALPLSSAWHSSPNRIFQDQNTRKYGDERDFRRDDRKKLNGSPNWDRHNEPYLNNQGANTQPMICNNKDVCDFYERPRGNKGPNARRHPLSKPTNDVGTAMEFLKESIKPFYSNGKEKEFNASAYTEATRPTNPVPLGSTRWRNGSNMSGPETKMESKDYESIKPYYGNAKDNEFNASAYNEASRRPTQTVPQGPTRWRNSSNMSGPETKMESKDYESEEEEEESRNPRYGNRDELKIVNNGGGAKPFQNKDGYEKPQGNAAAVQFGQTRFPGSTMQKKDQNTYPEKIDSREASRRYGKQSSRPLEKEEYKGTINSTEAMTKYKGALVP